MSDSEIVPLNDGTNYGKVAERVKRLAREGGVRLSRHAQERMKERRFDMNDVLSIIKTGRITSHSCPNDAWSWKMEGTAVDGERAACVIAIQDHVVIVTIMKA